MWRPCSPTVQPSRMSLVAWRRRCPVTIRLAVRRIRARLQEPLEHGRLGLLGLEEQRIVLAGSLEQADERAEPDAPDPDHLHGRVHQPVAIEEDPPVFLQAVAVPLHRGLGKNGGELGGMSDDRRSVDDAAHAAGELGDLRQLVECVVVGGRLDQVLQVARAIGRRRTRGWRARRRRSSRRRSRASSRSRPSAWRTTGRTHARNGARRGHRSPDPCGHDQAGRQAQQVPLPRPDEGLVEVGHIEHEVTFRRREHPEVAQMGVARQLRVEPADREGRKVGRHRQRGPAIEGERGRHHPAVADRDQRGGPGRRLFLKKGDGSGRSLAGRQADGLVSGARARAASPSARGEEGSGATPPGHRS